MHLLLAYIDPGSGALLVQALIASSVGGLIVFRDAVWGLLTPFRASKTPEPAPVEESPESEPARTS